MSGIRCPYCSGNEVTMNFGDGETAWYYCRCGCSFIVLKEGEIPEREEHARDIWPN